jgi:PTS system fructose-specific IIC component
MAKIVAVMACPTGIAHTVMAAEALEKTAKVMGHTLRAEMQGAAGVKNALTEQEICDAAVVIIATDIHIKMDRFVDKPVYAVSTSEAIRKTRAVIESALAEVEEAQEVAQVPAPASSTPVPPPSEDATKFLVGVTSCPTGIAHTFMAAEALRKAAQALGYEMKVETQGSVGAQNTLTFEEIGRADAVIIAADAFVDNTRFAGKRLYETSTNAALRGGQEVIKKALALPEPTGTDLADLAKEMKKARAAKVTGPYKHLMTGVSYMLPIVVAGGILIALSFAFGGIKPEGYPAGTLAWGLMQIGGGTAFKLFVPILAAFIAYSIADRPGIAPGIIGGALAVNLAGDSTVGTSGFLGGLVAGFLAGYVTLALNTYIKLPKNLRGLMPVLVLPLLSTLIVGLLMVFVVGPPMVAINTGLTNWLKGMQTGSAVVLGLILGAMMAFDMGGPVNKAAYAFSVGLLSAQIYQPMAAVMAAGMTPPLGLAIAAFLFKNRFTDDEQEAAPAAAVLGISFITEGAIPFAARDPLRTIPSLMVGSAVTAGLSMLFKCGLHVPHGGIFVLPIPNAVDNLGGYLLAIVIGTVVTVGMLFALKKPLAKTVQVFAREVAVA